MKKIKKILLFFPALWAAVALRLLRPWVVIRLWYLDISRIGGLYPVEWYISVYPPEKRGKNFDIFYAITINKTVCNQQWLTMWQRVARIVRWEDFLTMINAVSMKLPGHQMHVIPSGHVGSILKTNKDNLKLVLANKKPNIAFTDDEERFGQQALKDLGVPEGRPFICFHSRDSAYLNTKYPQMSWGYHDYRDSSIYNYVPAVEAMVRQGYSAVRMGAIVKEKLTGDNPDIIDYANNGQRTDFLDIYLGAKCAFFLASDTGITIVPEIFRKPVIYTNWTLFRMISPWVLHGLVIFKKFYSHRQKRLLTFAEMMVGPDTTEGFAKEQIELIENTPEEIKEVTLEMEDRLKGRWQSTGEDEELQERFWALYGPDLLKSQDLRIGAKFLRQYKYLLDQDLAKTGR
jgi:putative glycosyltransferase (TIGR04372 family)